MTLNYADARDCYVSIASVAPDALNKVVANELANFSHNKISVSYVQKIIMK